MSSSKSAETCGPRSTGFWPLDGTPDVIDARVTSGSSVWPTRETTAHARCCRWPMPPAVLTNRSSGPRGGFSVSAGSSRIVALSRISHQLPAADANLLAKRIPRPLHDRHGVHGTAGPRLADHAKGNARVQRYRVRIDTGRAQPVRSRNLSSRTSAKPILESRGFATLGAAGVPPTNTVARAVTPPVVGWGTKSLTRSG